MERYKVRMRWAEMFNRCENPDHARYKDYGGRGIGVCKEWMDFESFYQWALANGIESGKFLDRIDNNGDYEPSNCQYVSQTTNSRNTRKTKYLTAFGETKAITAWAEDPRCVVTLAALRSRLVDGWEHEKALSVKDPVAMEAFGESKRLPEWIKDPRCVATIHMIRDRLEKGITLEDAMQYGAVTNTESRKDNIWVEAFGEKRILTRWLDDPRCEVTGSTLKRRLDKGMSGEEAMKRGTGKGYPNPK